MNKIRLLMLFGGRSNEHEVSRLSTASILREINKERYEITKVGITKEGQWFVTKATSDEIADGSWENLKDNKEATVNFHQDAKGIYTLDGNVIPVDCVFLGMHGQNAEDGTMQGLWEIVGLPYTGPHVMASATGMDKATAKIIAKDAGATQAKYYATDRYTFSQNPLGELENIKKALRNTYPMFVKPANSGSSVGITKAHDEKELFEGIKIAAEVDHRIVIEEGIVGREIEVAVLGNRNPQASAIGEIMAANEFYDYEAKYTNEATRTKIVDDLTSEEEDKIKNEAIKIYKAFSCRGLSRVDFFYTEDKKIVFNEINTLPGFTKISMYPQLWQAVGLSYSDLLDKLVDLAMEE